MPEEQLVAAPSRGEEYNNDVNAGTPETADGLEQASDAQIASLLGTTEKAIATPKPAAPEPATKTVSEAKPIATPTPTPVKPKNAVELAEARLASKRAQARNLEGFTEEQQKLLRHMPNETWAFVEPLLRQSQQAAQLGDLPKKYEELEKTLGEVKHYRYADHPEAYKLEEEYAVPERFSNIVKSMQNEYRVQLGAVRGGAKTIQLPQLNEQGAVVGYQTYQVTPTTADELLERIQQATIDQQQLSAQMDAVKAKHTDRWKSHDAKLNQIFDAEFKPHDKILGPIAKEILATFPKYFARTTEAKLMAYSLAHSKYVSESFAGEKAVQQVQAARSATAKAGGPSAQELATGVAPSKANGANDGWMTDAEFKRKYM